MAPPLPQNTKMRFIAIFESRYAAGTNGGIFAMANDRC